MNGMELKESTVIVNENFRSSGEYVVDQVHPDVIRIKISTDKNGKKPDQVDGSEPAPTSYIETMMHLFKGNVGPGCFAMADAVKNGGLILAPILILFLGIICVHAQHMLLKCSSKMKSRHKLPNKPDYAETVELCFLSSNDERWRKLAPAMRKICNIFICITQFGFCCVYFLFCAESLKQVLDYYEIYMDIHLLVAFVLIPVWLSALITNLKFLAPCSGVASLCMIVGIIITYYYSALDLPPITDRNFVTTDLHRLPLFFGTAIFSFEGIALVLPLQNAMKTPKNFSKVFGVLNVGMVFVTGIFISFGALGYWQYGEETEGSLTLNLPTHEILAQCVKLAIAMGVLLGYAIQFFISIQIMFPSIRSSIKFVDNHPFLGEIVFRTLMVLVTFAVAELVPNLSLLLSLIGAVCSTVLALALPPIIEFIILAGEEDALDSFVIIKNVVILVIAVLGFFAGGYESLSKIVQTFLI